ncbi:MAG: alpha/beta fold hydrolase, partial [Candidatus Binatia bacterium]
MSREISSMPSEGQFLDIRGRKIQVLRGGDGPPLLYLHSAGGEVAWLPFFDHLAQHFTVYVPAHPGFAESEGLDRIDTIEDLVFHYVDVLEALDLEQPLVAGTSLGGWLAAELAVHHPRRVRKLVLINPVGLKVDTALVGDVFAAFPNELRHMVFHDPESEL